MWISSLPLVAISYVPLLANLSATLALPVMLRRSGSAGLAPKSSIYPFVCFLLSLSIYVGNSAYDASLWNTASSYVCCDVSSKWHVRSSFNASGEMTSDGSHGQPCKGSNLPVKK